VNKFLEMTLGSLAGFEYRVPEFDELLKELPLSEVSQKWDEFCREYRNPERTAKEIIRSGYFLGCYEPAIILYERVREQNVPVRFVEMIDERYGEEDVHGHCFVELKLDGKWIITDPTQQEVLEEYPAYYIFFSEGPYKWNSFLEFYEAQKRFIGLNLLGEKG